MPASAAAGEELLGQAQDRYAAGALGDARQLAGQAVSILRGTQGRPSAAVARALVLAGQIDQETGRHDAAERSFQEASTLIRDLAGAVPVRVQALLALANLWRVQGRYPQAEALLLATLQLAETVGAETIEVAGVCNALGITGKYTGRFEAAEAWYRRALGITARVLGPDHPDIAAIYHNLGGLDHARGAFERAEAPARRAVEIRQRALGPQHLAVAADKAALASILDALGRPGEAEALLRDALAIFERAYGTGHYEVAVTLHNLAAIAHRQGDLAHAEALYRRALAIKEDVLGHGHPELATTLNNLALARQDRGDHTEALALFTRAVTILEDLVEPDHPVLSAARDHRAALAPEGTQGRRPAATSRAESLGH
jgi:tetratricopeptide (TPR) repeat protein